MKKVISAIIAVLLVFSVVVTQSARAEAPSTHPLIALTFDDGPDPIHTPALLNILKAKKVKATFFLNGNKVEKYPALAKRIKNEGHVIGNHSWDHPDFTHLTFEQARDQIVRTNNVIKKVTGVKPILFRYPFGSWSDAGNQAIRAEGMWGGVHWHDVMQFVRGNGTPWVGDWECGNSEADMVRYVLGNATDQAMILLHDSGIDTHDGSVCASHMDYVGTSIDALKKLEYRFGVVEIAHAPSRINNDTWITVVNK